MGTKNNPKNRKLVEKKQYNGKVVEPVLYNGVNAGHGKYMAAKYEKTSAADLICNENGRPLQWEEL